MNSNTASPTSSEIAEDSSPCRWPQRTTFGEEVLGSPTDNPTISGASMNVPEPTVWDMPLSERRWCIGVRGTTSHSQQTTPRNSQVLQEDLHLFDDQVGTRDKRVVPGR